MRWKVPPESLDMEISKQLSAPPLASVSFALLPFVSTFFCQQPSPFTVIINYGLNSFQTVATLLTSKDQIKCAQKHQHMLNVRTKRGLP
jgi:hypothetical protein